MQHTLGPGGGLQVSQRNVRRWRWDGRKPYVSAPIRCRQEQCYLARGATGATGVEHVELTVEYLAHDSEIDRRRLRLDVVADGGAGALLGWLETPEDATHLRIHAPDAAQGVALQRLILHAAAECDPKSHPLANVPRWDTVLTGIDVERIVVSPALECLRDVLDHVPVEVIAPRSRAALSAATKGGACVLDPEWIAPLGLDLARVEKLATHAWVLLDLETVARLIGESEKSSTRVIERKSAFDLMSARVEYADVATRGFALQDVLPYGVVRDDCTFSARVLSANASWKRYADDAGFATMLSSETPWENKCGDVLSAARPVGRGELIATDLPWLVAGLHGRLVAPRLARHLLRMHLGAPLSDRIQYWTHWDETEVVVRDIAEMVRRFPPLRTARWASDRPGVVRIGLTLPSPIAGRHLLIRSGRIDGRELHDGLAPEAMMIFMKWLAREARQRSAWAQRNLADLRVTWECETAAGLRYAMMFDAAPALDGVRESLLDLRRAADGLSSGAGIQGDASLAYQQRLTDQLLARIEAR